MEGKKICISGSGGQGVLLLGKILATAGMLDKKNVTWIPSYGAEVRGGVVNCTVIISSEQIGSPIVKNPDILIAMNKQALKRYAPSLVSGGLGLANQSLIDDQFFHQGILFVPAIEIAGSLSGHTMLANMVMLGALTYKTRLVPEKKIKESISSLISPYLISLNLSAFNMGLKYFKERN